MSLLYCHHLDNVAPQSVILASAEDAAYPATNLIDLNPGKPAKLTTATGSWVGDLGQAEVVDLVALWKHTFDAGLEVQFQMNATDAWGAPALSTTIVIPALPEDDYPVCPFVDLREVDGYEYSEGLRYWRLNVPVANSRNLAIGELWLGSVARTLADLQAPIEDTEDHPIVEHLTDYKVSLIYDRGVRVRALSAEGFAEPADAAALRAWYRACRGRARAGLLIPDSGVNDAWFVRFPAEGMTVRDHKSGVSTFAFKVQEIGAGLPL